MSIPYRLVVNEDIGVEGNGAAGTETKTCFLFKSLFHGVEKNLLEHLKVAVKQASRSKLNMVLSFAVFQQLCNIALILVKGNMYRL